jgi:uncharacterized membrane protein
MKNILTHSSDNEVENILYATGKLLRLLNIKVTATTLRKTLLSHPHYLSLLSITESLQDWKVDTYALKINAEELDEITCPFIAFLASGRKFITVTEVSAQYVHYFDGKNSKQKYLRADFMQAWDGIVLLAEPSEESGELGYKAILRKELVHNLKIPALLVVFLLAALFKIYYIKQVSETYSTYFTLLLFCKLPGIIVGGLLLLHEYDEQNSFTRQICSVGKKTNCSAVLSSRSSKIGWGVSWSEVGFVYFFGGFLFLMISGTTALPFSWWVNILTLPYIIYSIGYQAFKIRQWCILCLTVQFLLLSEFISAVTAYPSIPIPVPFTTADSLLLVFLSFFLPAFAWSFVKHFIYEAKARTDLQYQLARFKNSGDVFRAMLQKQPSVNGDTDGLGITIGNPKAKNTLIKICNPYCGPCAKAHPKIDTLINNNPNWKVQIIFSAKVNEDHLKYTAVSHLMAIAEKSEKENRESLKLQALHDWYQPAKSNTDKYQAFAAKYPMNGEIDQQEEKVHAMHEWCEKNAIAFTPTFFVNGYRLPDQYEITDLEYL